MRYEDRYGRDVLAAAREAAKPTPQRRVPAEHDLVVEHTVSEWCGAIVRLEHGMVDLEDGRGRVRAFPLTDGFLIDGEPVQLVPPERGAKAARAVTASGSFADPGAGRARTARASRIYVEGRHDAELVERIWGDDLRAEGVVVEYLGGVDDLAAIVRDFAPTPQRRLGVMVDHLVDGTKEQRIARDAMRASPPGTMLVLGHPYIDVWQTIKPARLGLTAWPTIPRGQDWKRGICAALGWPHATQADIARAWKRMLGAVRDYRDLEPALLGRMEELIDFVTAGH